MRTSTAFLPLSVLLCAILATGCYDQVRKEEISEDPSRINLRVRILDISTSHLKGYGETLVDIDHLIFQEEALKILRNIFVEVSDDLRYPHCDIDVTVSIRTKRNDASAEAIAELTIREGYGRAILLRSLDNGEYAGAVHETNDTIRNRAAFRALKAALQSLRDNQELIQYARKLHGEGIVDAPAPASQEIPAEQAAGDQTNAPSSDPSDSEEDNATDGQ